jgi:T5SS/PEP-CTERM-associated repeat protein
MHCRKPARRQFLGRHGVAATAALLLSCGPPALAQTPQTYYILTDSVAFSPDLPAPFDPAIAVQDLAGYQLQVGYAAAGSFTALAGAQLTIDYVGLGSAQNGSGVFTIDGGTTRVVGNAFSRMEIGGTGSGTLTVQNGGLLDAASATCSNSCYTGIGNDAGGTGTLNVTGVSSEARFRFLGVGQASAFTTGGITNAFVNVLAGGTLRTEGARVASMNSSPNGDGSETSNATVLVSGANSQWIVTRNSIDNTAAFLGIGSGTGSNGLVTVSSGGKLHIDGSGSSGPNDGLSVGANGKGKLTVTGTGSQVLTSGVNHFVNVGASGPLSDGTFEVLAGASASTLYLNVGRNGGTGTMLIDGAGSTLTQSGVGTNEAPGVNGPAFAHIGRNTGDGGGTGSVTVSGGGQWIINDGGGNGITSESGPGIAIGRGANSTGSLTITGAGSRVEISAGSVNPGSGDNYNPFFAVGFDNAATTSGTLMISDGGKLIMTGNAASTAANSRATHLAIGGYGDSLPANGTATVIGQGSEILVTGSDALISVGRGPGGNGTLNVLDGGKVRGTLMLVGTATTGTVNIDAAQLELTGQFNSPAVGATLAVGRGAGGYGVLNMSNAAALSITPQNLSGLLTVGGDSLAQGGTGVVTLSGGSSITFGGTVPGNNVNVGRYGMGTLDLSGGSLVDVGTTGTADFGRLTTGTGHLVLQSSSVFSANQIDVGGNSDTVAGGTGTAIVDGLGSELKAAGATAFIGVGRGGNGTLTVTDQGKVSGIAMSVGRAAGGDGKLVVDGASISMSGQQTAGNLIGANLAIGLGGGIGDVKIKNGSTVVIDNAGTNGANLLLGGSSLYPTGSGTLELSGGSRIDILGAAATAPGTFGKAALTIGNDNGGSGTLTMSGASTINVGSGTAGANGAPPVNFQADGAVYVARQAGSVGLLGLSGSSTINAGFVGVGVESAGNGKTLGTPGGTGTLDLGELGSEGKIVAPRFELGAGSTLTGSGDIDAGPTGQVVLGGTVVPGKSPGRIRIYCDVTMLAGSRLILEVDGSGADVPIDQLVIGNTSTFDLTQLQIVFAFVGDTNPNEVDLNLNKYLRTSDPGGANEASLATRFGDKDWDDFINSDFAFQSSAFDVTNFRFDPDTGLITGIQASPVPEPATFALVLLAVGLMMATARQRATRRPR